MRVLDIFTTLLILGIWGPAVTRALSSSTDEIMRKIQELENIPDLTTSYEGRSKLAEIDRMVGEKCRENGGPNAYENLAKGLQDFMGCVQSELDMLQLEAEIGNAKSNGNWKPVSNRICRKFPALTKCGRPLTESIKSCLEPEERDNVDATQRIMGIFLELSCHDGGDQAALFVATGGPECLSSKQESLKVCGTELFRRNPRAGLPLEALIPENLSSLDLDEKDCDDIESLRNCTVAALNDCENPESAVVIDSMFVSFQRLASCRNIIESSTQAYGETSTTPLVITTTPKRGAHSNSGGNLIRNKCEKNGGPKAYDTAEKNLQFASNAYRLVLNGPQLGSEISTSQANGEMDTLVEEYCRRAPIFNELDKYLVDSVKPCLELEEQRTVDVIYNVSSATLDFICHDEGAPIKTAIASGGLACVLSQQEALHRCAYENFNSHVEALPLINRSSDTLPALDSKFCADLDTFKDCSVKLLARCENQTSANLLDSLLTSISDIIPCGNSSEPQPPAVLEIPNTTYGPEFIEISDVLPATESDIAIITGLAEPESMNMTKEEVEEYLRQKCERNSGPMAYKTAEQIPEYLSSWYESVKEDALQVVSDTAISQRDRPYGELNIVYMKYCRKVPFIKLRMRYVAESIKLCLDPEDREQVDMIRNIGRSMLEFGCQNKADNIAKFLATGGAECWAHSDGAVQNCVKQMSPDRVQSPQTRILHHVSIAECPVLRGLQSCVVNAMKECKDPTPATIMDSLLNDVFEQISCK